jgi:hypothetical protein
MRPSLQRSVLWTAALLLSIGILLPPAPPPSPAPRAAALAAAPLRTVAVMPRVARDSGNVRRLAPDPPRARPQPAPASAPAPRWPALLAQADAGDPHAACRLTELLEDCRLVADVADMVETQISVAAAELDGSGFDAAAIAALDTSVDPLRALCADVPPELAQRSWSFLLRAAIAGHEPSMFRYVVDPPLQSAGAHEHRAALAAYRDNAALFVAHLLQRASPQALALGFRAAQGEAFVAGRAIQARDPHAIVRIGTALLVLRDADTGSEDIVAQASAELLPSQAQHARNEGRLLADRFLRAGEPDGAQAAGDDCSAGWPGMPSEFTAYTF